MELEFSGIWEPCHMVAGNQTWNLSPLEEQLSVLNSWAISLPQFQVQAIDIIIQRTLIKRFLKNLKVSYMYMLCYNCKLELLNVSAGEGICCQPEFSSWDWHGSRKWDFKQLSSDFYIHVTKNTCTHFIKIYNYNLFSEVFSSLNLISIFL